MAILYKNDFDIIFKYFQDNLIAKICSKFSDKIFESIVKIPVNIWGEKSFIPIRTWSHFESSLAIFFGLFMSIRLR